MGERSACRGEDRARLRELVEAISGELARGRSEEAVAEDLLGLGLDRETARRIVAGVAGGPPSPSRRGEGPGRLITDALLLAAAAGVAFACWSAREHGIPIYIAAVAG